MQIIETDLFKEQRDEIVFYIAKDKKGAALKFAKDKKGAALKFAKELKKSVNTLSDFPYKCRPSVYYNDENIRDMIFMGYSIIYRVNKEKNVIEILEIFNQNLPKKAPIILQK